MDGSENPYLFKQVSLLSTSDVRYEGRLYIIDLEARTLALQHVKCLGTEGRRRGDESIPPSECTYEFIIFRAENIRSLNLSDQEAGERDLTKELLDPLKGVQRQSAERNYRTAPVRKRRVGAPPPNQADYYEQRSYGRDPRDRRAYEGYGYTQQYDYDYDYNNYGYAPSYNYGRYGYRGGNAYSYRRNYGGYDYRRRQRGYYQQDRRRGVSQKKVGTGAFLDGRRLAGHEIETPKDDFDFVTANEQIEERELKNPTDQETKVADNEKEAAYDKSESFFDNLTLATRETKKDIQGSDQRVVDAQTFGSVAQSYKPRSSRGRPRGGMRGQGMNTRNQTWRRRQ